MCCHPGRLTSVVCTMHASAHLADRFRFNDCTWRLTVTMSASVLRNGLDRACDDPFAAALRAQVLQASRSLPARGVGRHVELQQ